VTTLAKSRAPRAVQGQITVKAREYTWRRDDGTVGTGTHYVASATIDGKRVKRPRKSPSRTIRKLKAVADDVARGHVTGSRVRGRDMINDWLRTCRINGLKPRALRCNEEYVEVHVEPALGVLTARQLEDAATFQRFRDERKSAVDKYGRKLAPLTIKGIYNAARAPSTWPSRTRRCAIVRSANSAPSSCATCGARSTRR
jgi:hypothetical protein